MNHTQRQAWTEAVEVPRREMRRRVVINQEQYAFYQDVLRRLEQTNGKNAIRYHFQNAKTAERYRTYLSGRVTNDLGRSTISTLLQRNGTGAYLYVARGKNWTHE